MRVTLPAKALLLQRTIILFGIERKKNWTRRVVLNAIDVLVGPKFYEMKFDLLLGIYKIQEKRLLMQPY